MTKVNKEKEKNKRKLNKRSEGAHVDMTVGAYREFETRDDRRGRWRSSPVDARRSP